MADYSTAATSKDVETVQAIVEEAGEQVSSAFVVSEATKKGVAEVEAYRALILLADERRIRILPGLWVAPSDP